MADAFAGQVMLTVIAPAKINLTLEVLGKRPDGFHEIRSVIQAVTLCDTLRFQPGPGTVIRGDMPGWSAELSLVARAVELVADTSSQPGGATIEVEKRIPLMSGLGGDSSDAAATLRGLDHLWGLNLPDDRLRQLAARLGSDVTFFLHGGTALVTGRGEQVMELPPLPATWFVILLPPVPQTPGKTGRMYARLEPGHYTGGQATVNLVSSIALGGAVSLSRLVNVFDNIALDVYPDLEDYWAQFADAGAREIHLAGSGPALFSAFHDGDEAERVYTRLQESRVQCYLAENFSRGGGR